MQDKIVVRQDFFIIPKRTEQAAKHIRPNRCRTPRSSRINIVNMRKVVHNTCLIYSRRHERKPGMGGEFIDEVVNVSPNEVLEVDLSVLGISTTCLIEGSTSPTKMVHQLLRPLNMHLYSHKRGGHLGSTSSRRSGS